MNITLDKDSLLNVSKQMMDEAEDLAVNISHLLYIIDSINNAWDGHDALKYINVMRDKYIVSLQDLKNIILEYANYLDGVIDAYSILDEAFSSKAIEV